MYAGNPSLVARAGQSSGTAVVKFDPEHLRIAAQVRRDARRRFLRQHLVEWGLGFVLWAGAFAITVGWVWLLFVLLQGWI